MTVAGFIRLLEVQDLLQQDHKGHVEELATYLKSQVKNMSYDNQRYISQALILFANVVTTFQTQCDNNKKEIQSLNANIDNFKNALNLIKKELKDANDLHQEWLEATGIDEGLKDFKDQKQKDLFQEQSYGPEDIPKGNYKNYTLEQWLKLETENYQAAQIEKQQTQNPKK